MDLIELKEKISRSENYTNLIKILGKSGNIRNKQIIKQGINANSLNPKLKIALYDGIIEKNIDKNYPRYSLSNKGKNIYDQFEEVKLEKNYQKKFLDLQYINRFFRSADFNFKNNLNISFLTLRDISPNYSKYLAKKIILHVVNSHPKILYMNGEIQNLSSFIKDHFKAAFYYQDLLVNLRTEFQKVIIHLIESRIRPRLIEIKIKNAHNNENIFYMLENDPLVKIIDTIILNLLLNNRNRDVEWITENCMKVLKENKSEEGYIQFLEKHKILENLINNRAKYKFSKLYIDRYSEYDYYSKNIDDLLPLLISNFKIEHYYSKSPKSIPQLEAPIEIWISYISKVGFICDIRNEYNRGLKLINEALKISPKNHFLYIIKAIILFHLYKFNSARKSLNKASCFLKRNYKDDKEFFKNQMVEISKINLYIHLFLSEEMEFSVLYEELLDLNVEKSILHLKYDVINREFISPKKVSRKKESDEIASIHFWKRLLIMDYLISAKT